jgi:hypothetical protein
VPGRNNGERKFSSINKVGKTEYTVQNNETGLFSHTRYKNELKTDEKVKHKV